MEAEAVSSAGTGRPVEKNNRPPMSPGASADEDIKALVATVDKARRAAQNTSQVCGRLGCLVLLLIGMDGANRLCACVWASLLLALTALTG